MFKSSSWRELSKALKTILNFLMQAVKQLKPKGPCSKCC